MLPKLAIRDRKASEPFISKSTFLLGLQCPKLLWFRYNAKDQIPKPDSQTQTIFDQGHEVGKLARQLFPSGIEIARGITDFDEVHIATAQAIDFPLSFFEPGFKFDAAYARADILNSIGTGE